MTLDRYKGKRHTITMPEPLYNKIVELASKEQRSVSQQIIRLCEIALEDMKKREE